MMQCRPNFDESAATEAYRHRCEVFDAGWAAREANLRLDENPHPDLPVEERPQLPLHQDADYWVMGWEAADQWLKLGVSNWCREGADVRCVVNDRVDGVSFKGQVGTIIDVCRWGLLGYVKVRFPRKGRQKSDRETYFDLRREQIVPV